MTTTQEWIIQITDQIAKAREKKDRLLAGTKDGFLAAEIANNMDNEIAGLLRRISDTIAADQKAREAWKPILDSLSAATPVWLRPYATSINKKPLDAAIEVYPEQPPADITLYFEHPELDVFFIYYRRREATNQYYDADPDATSDRIIEARARYVEKKAKK